MIHQKGEKETSTSFLVSLTRRALPAEEQVFIVVADSVMKQMDGLKVMINQSAVIVTTT